MTNIFQNDFFGKRYKTRSGIIAIYHGSSKYKSGDGTTWTYHHLILEPQTIEMFGDMTTINLYTEYINDDGIGRFANLKYCKSSGVNAKYDIITEE